MINLNLIFQIIILLGENCTYEVGGIEKFENASESSYQYKKGETKKMGSPKLLMLRVPTTSVFHPCFHFSFWNKDEMKKGTI